MKSWRLIIPTIALIAGMAIPRATAHAAVPAPGSPTNVMAWAGNQSVHLTWETPYIATMYKLSQYRINVYRDDRLVQMLSFAAPASEKVVTGLSNYHTYTFTLQMTQSTVGDNPEESPWSDPSAPSNPVIPPGATVPGGLLPLAPTQVDAHSSYASAFVSWVAPSYSGHLTTYQVTAYKSDGKDWNAIQRVRTSAYSPTATWVTSLENGGSYRFTVQAANFAGWGPESALTDPAVTPGTTKLGSPFISSIVLGDGSMTLTWSGPIALGIDHYVVLVTRAEGSLVTYRDGMLSQVTIDGLTNGVPYTVEVRAVGLQHMLGNPARTQVTLPVAIPPAAPTNLHFGLNDRAVALYWDAPAANPRAPIDHYTVSIYLDSVTVWTGTNVHATSVGVSGLLAGRTYTVEVRSVSTANLMSDPATIRFSAATIPGAPTGVHASLDNGRAVVTWTAPALDGASPLTQYIVQGSSGLAKESLTQTVGANQTSATFGNLMLGRTYTFTVQALNAVGGGTLSAPSNAVTVATVPGPARNLSVTAGDESATLRWDAAASDGGSAILGYEVTASDGVHAPIAVFTTGTSVTLTGLTNGVHYSISVMARNALGLGSAVSGEVHPVNLAPTLTIPGNQTVQYSDTLPLVVRATGPEANDHLILSASGLPAGLTFTDRGNGTGEITGAVQGLPGMYSVTVSVNDGHNPVESQIFTITVSREDALITPKNPTSLMVKKTTDTTTVKVQATIGEKDATLGNLAATAPVTMTLKAMGSGTTITRTATLTRSGTALTATATFEKLPINVYRVSISVGGSYYQGQAASLMTLASSATRGSISGTGDVASQRAPGAVDLQATIRKNGTVAGSLNYSGHHPEGDFVLNGKLVGGLVIKNHRAFFQGRGTLNGVPGYRFAVGVIDNRHLESDGQVAIWTIDPQNQVIGHCTFSLTPITSGQMVVISK